MDQENSWHDWVKIRLTASDQTNLSIRRLDWSTSPYVAAFFAFGGRLLTEKFETGHVASYVDLRSRLDKLREHTDEKGKIVIEAHA